MGNRKEKCAIDVVGSFVYEVKQRWAGKKLAAALFMDVKETFDHVSKTQVVARILELQIEGDFIYWIKLFLMNQNLQLVIDSHNNPENDIKTGISEKLPVSPIQFLKYISRVFE